MFFRFFWIFIADLLELLGIPPLDCQRNGGDIRLRQLWVGLSRRDIQQTTRTVSLVSLFVAAFGATRDAPPTFRARDRGRIALER